jgi:hypothetical protein
MTSVLPGKFGAPLDGPRLGRMGPSQAARTYCAMPRSRLHRPAPADRTVRRLPRHLRGLGGAGTVRIPFIPVRARARDSTPAKELATSCHQHWRPVANAIPSDARARVIALPSRARKAGAGGGPGGQGIQLGPTSRLLPAGLSVPSGTLPGSLPRSNRLLSHYSDESLHVHYAIICRQITLAPITSYCLLANKSYRVMVGSWWVLGGSPETIRSP